MELHVELHVTFCYVCLVLEPPLPFVLTVPRVTLQLVALVTAEPCVADHVLLSVALGLALRTVTFMALDPAGGLPEGGIAVRAALTIVVTAMVAARVITVAVTDNGMRVPLGAVLGAPRDIGRRAGGEYRRCRDRCGHTGRTDRNRRQRPD